MIIISFLVLIQYAIRKNAYVFGINNADGMMLWLHSDSENYIKTTVIVY